MVPIKRLLKLILGLLCVTFQFLNLWYHMYFFVRYFLLDFALTNLKVIPAALMSCIGVYFLVRVNILLMLCVYTNAGSVTHVRDSRKGCDSVRVKRMNLEVVTGDDKATLLDIHGSYKASCRNQPMCDKCNEVKFARAHHCTTCGQCVLRMDHHCPWLNNCIGVANFRFFVQLLLHVSLGSCFTLLCIYTCRDSGLWHHAFGNAWVFVAMHSFMGFFFFTYFMYYVWLVNRDLTSFDLFYRQEKDRRYTRFV
jgi:hypothetical protein